MKKILLTILLLTAMVSSVWAAATPGSCTQTDVANYVGGHTVIKLVCTGASDSGSIPDTALNSANMALILGTHYLYQVKAYPTTGGTAPDAADVQILMDGQDILGAKGVNLIHATATQDTVPYSAFMALYRCVPVTATLTLKVANQATASANYTVELDLLR